jgi:hypothetical protein
MDPNTAVILADPRIDLKLEALILQMARENTG